MYGEVLKRVQLGVKVWIEKDFGNYLEEVNGANDGDRTRDNRNHNPGLYQLSYIRHSRL